MHIYIQNNQGSALLLVLVIGLIVLVVGMSASVSLGDGSKKVQKRHSSLQLFNITEAGKERGLAKLRSKEATPPEAGINDTLIDETTFAGGVYMVTCSTVASHDTSTKLDTFLIRSKGSFKTESKQIEIRCVNDAVNPYDTCAVFDYMFYSGTTFTWSGSGGMNNGKVHANGIVTKSGGDDLRGTITSCVKICRYGSGSIYGDVTAPVFDTGGSGHIYGAVNKSFVNSISTPAISFETLYKNYAQSNSQFYQGNVTYNTDADVIVPGGILYVNGSFSKSGKGKFTGCIIATGNIDISGSGNCTSVGDLPFAVSTNGNITWSGTGTMNINGLIYAQNGSFTHSGSKSLILTGQLIVKTLINKSGTGDFTVNYKRSVPVSPTGGGSTTSAYKVLSWREL